jgi:UDP-N-acetyl-D-glucosamine dehydrogenase
MHLQVVIVGQGSAGLPLAMRAVEVGHRVVGHDIDEGRVKRLLSGDSYVDHVPSDRLAAALDTGRYLPTTDSQACENFDVAVITIPTPSSRGVPEWSLVESAAVTLARHLRPGATVVLESTTYPGTTDLLGTLLENHSGLAAGSQFHLGYSPQRVDPGNPEWNLVNIPKIVSGIDAASLVAVKDFYDGIVDKTVPVVGTREAELAKLLETAFRHVNIALINEIAIFAGHVGVDVWEAIEAASTKPSGFLPFKPGPGVGGESLSIDPSYLPSQARRNLGRSFRFVEVANDVNDRMPYYVVSRVMAAVNRQGLPMSRCRVLILGLAYKRNVGDDRESPAVVIAEQLLALGADVRAADPHVVDQHVDSRVRRVDASPEELAAADLVVLLTDHDAFDLGAVRTHGRFIFDTRHCLEAGENVEFL